MTEPLLSGSNLHGIGSVAAEAIGNDSRFAFIRKLREERLANLRPVGDFFDVRRIKFTSSFATVSQRWSHNLQHYSANYLLIIILLGIYAIFTNWWLLFTIGFIFGGFYLIAKLDGVTVFGKTLSGSSLYASYICVSLVLLFFSGATGSIFWVIGAAAILVLGHAALLEPGIENDFGANQV